MTNFKIEARARSVFSLELLWSGWLTYSYTRKSGNRNPPSLGLSSRTLTQDAVVDCSPKRSLFVSLISLRNPLLLPHESRVCFVAPSVAVGPFSLVELLVACCSPCRCLLLHCWPDLSRTIPTRPLRCTPSTVAPPPGLYSVFYMS